MVNCFELATENLTPEACANLPLTLEKICSDLPEETYKFNTRTRKRFTKADQDYPECPFEKEWNSKDIRNKILSWKSSIEDNQDLHWFHDYSPEPLDLSNPVIEITFEQLVGRQGFEKRKVSIVDRKLI